MTNYSSTGESPFGNKQACNDWVDSLPFGDMNEPVWTAGDVALHMRGGAAVSDEVRTTYCDYYGLTTIRFNATDNIPDSLPEHAIVIPRSRWKEWNIVVSGADVYAEPVSTTVLELGAVAHPAAPLIDTLIGELDTGNLSEQEKAAHLRMLGRLPLFYSGFRTMEADILDGLRIEESVIDFKEDASGVVVHTPRQEVGPDVYSDRVMLLKAQSWGIIESTCFDVNGQYCPDGVTRGFRYGRAGIPIMQIRFMRRAFRS